MNICNMQLYFYANYFILHRAMYLAKYFTPSPILVIIMLNAIMHFAKCLTSSPILVLIMLNLAYTSFQFFNILKFTSTVLCDNTILRLWYYVSNQLCALKLITVANSCYLYKSVFNISYENIFRTQVPILCYPSPNQIPSTRLIQKSSYEKL